MGYPMAIMQFFREVQRMVFSSGDDVAVISTNWHTYYPALIVYDFGKNKFFRYQYHNHGIYKDEVALPFDYR